MSEQSLSRRRRVLAILLALLIPGGGHMLLGRAARGLNLLLVSVVAVAAMIYYANEAGGRHLLMLVLLGLTVPVVYFYSVYDALQQLAKCTEEKSAGAVTLLQGMALSLGGVALLILMNPPAMLTGWLEAAGIYAPGVTFILLGIWLAWRMAAGRARLGRGTASACLLAVGLYLLAAPPALGGSAAFIAKWWPVGIVLLGIEITLFAVRRRQQEIRLSMDWIGMAAVVVLLGTSYAVTELADIPYRWLDQFKSEYNEQGSFTEEKGQRFEGKTLYGGLQPAEELVHLIEVVNANGNLTVISTDEPDVRVESEVWVDLDDREAARQAADAAGVSLNREGGRLLIKGAGELYGEKQLKPRINMTVYLPSSLYAVEEAPPAEPQGEPESLRGEQPQLELEEASASTDDAVSAATSTGDGNAAESGLLADQEGGGLAVSEEAGSGSIEQGQEQAQEQEQERHQAKTEPEQQLAMKVKIQNGTVSIDGSLLYGGLEVDATYSRLYLQQIAGPLSATVKSGSIEGQGLRSASKLLIDNGNIIVAGAIDDLSLSTVNGSIQVQHAAGSVEAETKNGQIEIHEAAGIVKADTLNGSIEAASSVVGGPWDLDSSIGEIRLGLPEQGDYAVFGAVTFGEIYTELPLEVSGKKVSGALGEGRYNIRVNANSSIYLKKYIADTTPPFIDKQ